MKFFKNDQVTMWVEEGILHFYFNKNAEITLDIAKDFVRKRKQLCEGKAYPAVIDSTGLKWASQEARAFLASDVSLESIEVSAFVVNGTVQKIFTTFFLTFYKPPVPVKVFSHLAPAIKWINEYCENRNLNY